ncbi:MAG: hypothetical protein NT107_11750 [Planctomycetota bacterium]|nr:hypothetical protein [Planctomycetota bacterium]
MSPKDAKDSPPLHKETHVLAELKATWSFFLTACTLSILAAPAMTQRGGGRSDALTERLSVYITDAKLPEKAAGEDRFESVPTVTAARAKHELLLLYLVDSSAEEPKREAFESVMFGSEELAVALRCFHLVRIDIAADAEAKVKYGRRLPVFLPSDENGKSSGDIALTGYKAAITGLISLLEKSASGHVKPTLSTFISDYRGVVHDLSVIELQRKAMKDRIARLTDEKKKASLEKDASLLDTEEQKLLGKERDIIERAKVLPRDADAKKFDPKRGR